MNMTGKDYKNLFNSLKISPQHQIYSVCRNDYTEYLKQAKNICENVDKIILLFLESFPQKTVSNYIFSRKNGGYSILGQTNNYLHRIYCGFYDQTTIKRSDTNLDLLDRLLKYKNGFGKSIPVIIFDLFPFHGVSLKNQRHAICNVINTNPLLLLDVLNDMNLFKNIQTRLFLFGVPYTIWNNLGGFGKGSIYINTLNRQTGLLGDFHNKSVVINVGGQNINSKKIIDWRNQENI